MAAALLSLLLVVSACAPGGGGSTAPGTESVLDDSSETPRPDDDPTEPGTDTPGDPDADPGSPTGPEDDPEPLPDESPPILTSPSPPAPGKEVPGDRAGHLRFWNVRVYDRDGRLTVHANLTNESAEYLNGVEFSWRAFARGEVVDRGTGSWPSLAPEETVSVDLPGTAEYTKTVDRVDFQLT